MDTSIKTVFLEGIVNLGIDKNKGKNGGEYKGQRAPE
jgi:hypothetical protein